jgi:hypothetical protein
VRTAIRFDEIVLIDGMVKLLLEMYAVPYLTIATLSMQERARTVDEVIRLRYPGLAPIRGARRRDEAAAGNQAEAQAATAASAPGSATAPAKGAAPARPTSPPPTPAQPAGMPAIPAPLASNGGIPDPLLIRYRDLSLDLTPDS